MIHDVLVLVLQAAQTQVRVGIEQEANKLLRRRIESRDKFEVLSRVEDLLDRPVLIGVRERRLAHVQLVDEDTQGPGIGRLVVTLSEHELGREVFWGSAQRVRLVVQLFVFFKRNALCKPALLMK